MIYEFRITEMSSAVISVRAKTPDEAQKIFDDWYRKHEDELNDGLIAEMLDNGYDGRKFERSAGIDEKTYIHQGVLLPEEENAPPENFMAIFIRFADGQEPYTVTNTTMSHIGELIAEFSKKYYLYPDPQFRYWMAENAMHIYAVLKDEEETWYEFDFRKDPAFNEEAEKRKAHK